MPLMNPTDPPRVFVVDPAGTATDLAHEVDARGLTETALIFHRLGIAEQHIPALVEAAELLAADAVPQTTIGQLLIGCHRTGRDPVAFAHHFLHLRHALH